MKRVASKRERKLPDKSSPEGVYVAIPTLESYPWPSLSEPVSLKDAIAALTLGNAKIIARYLREPEDHYFLPVVTCALAELLDPSSGLEGQDESPSEALFGALGGDSFTTDLKLVFVPHRRRKPEPDRRRKPEPALRYWIGHMIASELGEPPNVEAAVTSVMNRTGVSRMTAYRGWRTYNSKREAYRKACEKQPESFDNSTAEEFENLLKTMEQDLSLYLQAREG
jgi:hypothetical protein